MGVFVIMWKNVVRASVVPSVAHGAAAWYLPLPSVMFVWSHLRVRGVDDARVEVRPPGALVLIGSP